jgi:hypothetical protein
MSMRRLAVALFLMSFASAPACAQQDLIDALWDADWHLLGEATDLLKGLEAKDTVEIVRADAPASKTLQAGTLRVVGSAIPYACRGKDCVSKELSTDKLRIEIFNGQRKVAQSVLDGPGATLQIVHLDRQTKLPQVLALVESGGSAGGNFVMLFDGGRDGTQWRLHEPDWHGTSRPAVDVFHDGSFHIVYYGDKLTLPGWGYSTLHYFGIDRMQLRTFRNGRFIESLPPEKLRRVYLHQLHAWYERFANDRSQAYDQIDADNEPLQVFALRYIQIKARLGETAQAWAAVTGPFGFSRNRKFLEDARKALVEARYVKDAAQLPLPP